VATSCPEIAAALAARGLDLAAPLAFQGRLAVVVGNTRALWPRLRAEADWTAPDPVDRYVEAAVRAAAPAGAEVRLATDPQLPIQQLADDAGLAWLSPSRVCVHPVFGPWIALRALIVTDAPAPAPAARIAPPCDCARGCGEAFARACAAGVPAGTAELRERWRLWLAVRDACPVGRAHRYSDDAIAYHYAGVRP
jgi:methylmalonic aciduria homocystinuria type C protein